MIYPLIKNILCHIMPWILISGGLVLLGLGIRQYKQSKKSKPFLVGLVFILPFVLFAVLTLPFLLLYSHHTVSSTDTDGNGYLFFTRVILSARNSYLISVIATLIALFFGIILGLATVSDKKNIDRLVIFLIQIIETVPRLFLLIIVLALLDSWIGSVASMKTELIVPILGLCIGATCIPKISRFIRQKAKTVYATDFVDASKAHGVSSRRILLYHFLWKNCLNDLIIQATYLLGFCLLVETSLACFPHFLDLN